MNLNYDYIPYCEVEFSGYLNAFDPIEIAAYNILDLVRGISCNYPEFERELYRLANEGKAFVIKVNDKILEGISSTQTLIPFIKNKIQFICTDRLHGKNILPVLLGVALVGAAFAGVGILGISSTTIGLLGASLVATSIFKSPKTNTNERTDKRSNNFTGTINTTGGGQPLALVFGEAWIGSVVASAFISPESRPVN